MDENYIFKWFWDQKPIAFLKSYKNPAIRYDSYPQKNIATNDAHELMTEALLQDRVEFVKLLLDHSYVNLARYMTPKVLR